MRLVLAPQPRSYEVLRANARVGATNCCLKGGPNLHYCEIAREAGTFRHSLPVKGHAHSKPSRVPRLWLRVVFYALLSCAAWALWLYREPLQTRVAELAILANDAPPPEWVEGMIQNASDPVATVIAAWNSQKIVHGQVAIRELGRLIQPQEPLSSDLESILLAAAFDPDLNVRESAFAILAARRHPDLLPLCAAQLSDPDPHVRLLALSSAKHLEARSGVPLIIPLLADPDSLVATTGLKLLEHWSGESFGVKLSDAASARDSKLATSGDSPADKIQAGVAKARAWWSQHQKEFSQSTPLLPRDRVSRRRIAAGNASLRTPDGRVARLTDFRGKTLLINFWTTWCTACLAEIPELIALQQKHGERVAILGVSLDLVPDLHGHVGGHSDPRGESHHEHGAEPTPEELQRLRDKVAQTAKARGINYLVLLDEKNELGGRFHGGELPTTVIVDAQGLVRRRFVGARSLAVFAAMIAEAAQPLGD